MVFVSVWVRAVAAAASDPNATGGVTVIAAGVATDIRFSFLYIPPQKELK